MTKAWKRLEGGSPDGNPSAKARFIDPYEDWEKATRPPHLAVAPAPGAGTPLPRPNWQPVFVELTGRLGPPAFMNAKTLLELAAIETNNLRVTSDTFDLLTSIVAKEFATFASIPLELRRFFVFRVEAEAYLKTLADNTLLPYKILQVGPAIPDIAQQYLSMPREPPTVRTEALRAAEDAPVLTAVIDDQLGFLNERFQTVGAGTRVRKIWLQAMPDFDRPGLPDKGPNLDLAQFGPLPTLRFEEDCYRDFYNDQAPGLGGPVNVPRTGANPPTEMQVRPFGLRTGHGTQVLDLAAGDEPCRNRSDRPIIAVQLPSLATAESWGARLDLFILMGLIRILRWADTWKMPDGTPARIPVVVNISYGVLAGPKDGTGFLERQIARLVGLRNRSGVPTFVVWAAGNGFRARTHAQMVIGPEDSETVTLRVQPDDLSVTFTELWLDGVEYVALHIKQGSGPEAEIFISTTPAIWDWSPDGVTIGRLYVRRTEKDPRRLRVVLALCPTLNHDDPPHTAPAGAYEIRIENRGSEEIRVSMDVQRDDTPAGFPRFGRQAYLDHAAVDGEDPETLDRNLPRRGPVSRDGTLSSHATASTRGVVVVGAALDRDARLDREAPAAPYTASGAGLLRGGPDLSAVADETRAFPGRLATGFYSGSTSLSSGTSAAAPLVTRALVDWLADGGGDGGVVDLDALLRGGIRFKGQDARLGHGVLAYHDGPGRRPRRLRD